VIINVILYIYFVYYFCGKCCNEPSISSYSVVCVVPCSRLPYNEPGTTYTVLKYPEDVHASVATIPTTLRFMARDCDPTTGIPDADQGYHDEYMVRKISFIILMRIFILMCISYHICE